MNIKTLIAASTMAAAATVATAPVASAQALKVGQLNCQVAGGAGFVFGSSKALNCTFNPASGEAETYVGKINKFGIDIGVTGKQVIIWTVVMAEGGNYTAGDLAGRYSGASAEASFGVGLGANALVGGNKTFALQPFSVSASTGVNVAAGLSSVTLEPAG